MNIFLFIHDTVKKRASVLLLLDEPFYNKLN